MTNHKRWLLIDLVFMTSVVLAGMMVADYFDNDINSEWVARSENWSLGAEYNSIAQAIYSGRGFSDPFKSPSGPTAWMPPVYPYLLASLYWITDFQPTAVVEIVLGLKAISIVLTGILVIQVARSRGIVLLGYTFVPLGLMANFHDYFQTTHDVWILVLFVDLIWLGSITFWNTKSGFLRSACWGFFGGFCALCSPGIGGAWVACVITSIFIDLRGKRDGAELQRCIKTFLVVAFAAILTVTPWTVRNRAVLGKWIPIKSNSSFEIWQSLCIDTDGVLDAKVLSQHPWPLDGSERAKYVELGEIPFLEHKWHPIFESLRASPWSAVWKLRNRAIASLVYYFAYRAQDEERVWPMRFKRIVFPVPFIALLVCMAIGDVRKTREFQFGVVLYVAILAPYILISYYDRYAAPLLPIKLMLVLYALQNSQLVLCLPLRKLNA